MEHYAINENGLTLAFTIENGVLNIREYGLAERPVKVDAAENFAQVHLSGGNVTSGHNGIKRIGASESSELVYVGTEKIVGEKFVEYVIGQKSKKVEVFTHLRFFDGIKVFSVFNTVRNISCGDVWLEEVNGMLLFTPACEANENYSDYVLYVPHNSWHCEAQWKGASLEERGLYSGNGNTSMKRVSIKNTGSWSTKEYLPMGILHSGKENFCMLWQIESNGSWNYELGETGGKIYLNAGGPDYIENSWEKKLGKGESFTGVTVAFAFGSEIDGVLGEITDYRRAIRRKNSDNVSLPAIYNSYMHCLWDYPSFDGLKPLIDKAAGLGMEYFCIDAGWHDELEWWSAIGEWKVSKTRFPEGLGKTIDYVKSKGMKVGLWLEIECVGRKSGAVEYLKDCFFTRNGKPVMVNDRYFLDFTKEKTRKYADEVVDRIVSYGADYIKTDYNADAGVGTDDFGRKSAADGLLEHCRALKKWFEKIYERYPDLVVENCASGGCRMDYSMLSLHSIQSTSDQLCYLKYPYIAAGASSAVCPEQSAVWCYPVRGKLTPEEYERCIVSGEKPPVPDISEITEDDVVINVVNCLLGRMHLAGHIELLGGKTEELLKEGIAYYRAMSKDKATSRPYFPCGFPVWNDDFVAGGLAAGNKRYLAVWNLGGKTERTIDVGFPIKSVKVGYPASSKVKTQIKDGDKLVVSFKSRRRACVLEIIG